MFESGYVSVSVSVSVSVDEVAAIEKKVEDGAIGLTFKLGYLSKRCRCI